MDCLPRAVAEILGVSTEYVIEKLGHDGKAIVTEDIPPYCYAGWHLQEIIDVLLAHQVPCTLIEARPVSISRNGYQFYAMPDTYRMVAYLGKHNGIVMGRKSNDKYHAEVWKGFDKTSLSTIDQFLICHSVVPD